MGNKKILIVEDDPDVLQEHARTSPRPPLRHLSAEDAISCMAEARKSEPDLIILDLGLPAGDGFCLMDRFKKCTRRSHQCRSSWSPAATFGDNQKKVVESGAKAFLQKPVDNAKLLAVIRQSPRRAKLKEEPVVYNLGNP